MDKTLTYAGVGIIVLVIALAAIFYIPQSGNKNTSTISTTSLNTSISSSSTITISTTTTATTTTTVTTTILNEEVYVANLGNFSTGGGTISVINTTTNKVTATIPGGISAWQTVFKPNSVYAFALTQSGISGYHNISMINILDNTFIMNITLGGASSITTFYISMSPNGQFLYALTPECPSSTTVGGVTEHFNKPSMVQIINLSTYQLTKTLTVGSCSSDLAFSPNGNYAYVVNRNSSVSAINTSSMTLATIPIVGQPASIVFGLNGKNAYVISYNNQTNTSTLSIINTSLNSVSKTLQLGHYSSFGGAINPVNKLLYVLDYAPSNSISIINTSTDSVVKTVNLSSEPSEMVFTPNGNSAYVLGDSGIIYTINLSADSITSQIQLQSGAYGMNITSDGRFLYVANGNNPGFVSVINTTTNKVIKNISVGINPSSIGIVNLQNRTSNNFLSNYAPLTPPEDVYLAHNITSGFITVSLFDLSYPNSNGTSAAAFGVYNHGVLTNETSIFPKESELIDSSGYNFIIYVNQTYPGVYAYQKWASVQLYKDV